MIIDIKDCAGYMQMLLNLAHQMETLPGTNTNALKGGDANVVLYDSSRKEVNTVERTTNATNHKREQ